MAAIDEAPIDPENPRHCPSRRRDQPESFRPKESSLFGGSKHYSSLEISSYLRVLELGGVFKLFKRATFGITFLKFSDQQVL